MKKKRKKNLHDQNQKAINHLINDAPLQNDETDSVGTKGCFAPKKPKLLKISEIESLKL